MSALPERRVRAGLFVVSACALALLPGSAARAACPPGQSNPITSGPAKGRPAIIFSKLGGGPAGSFFVLGAAGLANSGSLPLSDWLVNLGDLDGDGIPEYAVEAPGEGPGGWGDPRTIGCPSTLTPPRPPLVLQIQHDREDRDGDGRFDIFEDINHNGRLDPGEDLDGDGRLTPRDGCEGVMREDVDGDGRLDLISEDANFNGILDPGEDLNQNGRLDIGPYIEDRNHDQFLNDRPLPSPNDVIYQYFPDGTRVQISSWYPYGSFIPAPGGIVTALVSWNGTAYDLSSMPSSTRLIFTLEDLLKNPSRR